MNINNYNSTKSINFVVRDTSILFPEYDVTVIKIPSLSNKFMIPFDTYKMNN
jgi:hypothetical protein